MTETTHEIAVTFHNIIDTQSVGEIMELYEAGVKRLYMIVGVIQIDEKTTYRLVPA